MKEGKWYDEADLIKYLKIKEREAKSVTPLRDLINQYKKSREPNYFVRVTANDAELGEQYLREFQDNQKTNLTILTTSQKLSTGVDIRNIRNIVLIRPVNSMN